MNYSRSKLNSLHISNEHIILFKWNPFYDISSNFVKASESSVDLSSTVKIGFIHVG